MEGDDALVHSMENLIVDKKPTEYEDPAIVRFAIRSSNLEPTRFMVKIYF